MTVKAVIFDVGKVLVEWDPRHLYEKLIPDAAERCTFLRASSRQRGIFSMMPDARSHKPVQN